MAPPQGGVLLPQLFLGCIISHPLPLPLYHTCSIPLVLFLKGQLEEVAKFYWLFSRLGHVDSLPRMAYFPMPHRGSWII